MIETLARFAEHPFATPVLVGVLCCGVIAELFLTGRFQKRTFLGRLLGYAPAKSKQGATPELEARFLELQDRLLAQTAQNAAVVSQRIEEIGDAVETIQRDVAWLATDHMLDTAAAIIKSGASVEQISKSRGLSDEDIALMGLYGRN